MTERVETTSGMISGMTPTLMSGVFVFATATTERAKELLPHAIASFHEAEGLSLILPSAAAKEHGIAGEAEMRCITLNVYSSLEGVGLTAAVAQALAENGIACNMVAAFHHDHAFVPTKDADRAMQVLTALQAAAKAGLT